MAVLLRLLDVLDLIAVSAPPGIGFFAARALALIQSSANSFRNAHKINDYGASGTASLPEQF
jgi:hypothetical protein